MTNTNLKPLKTFIFLFFSISILAAQNFEKIENLIDSSQKYSQIDFEKAMIFAEEALELSNKDNNKKGIAYSKYQFGNNFLNMAEYSAAESNLLTALQIFENLNIQKEIINSQNRLGWLYVLMAEYGKAVSYSNKALQNKEITDVQKAISFNNIASSYFYIGNYKEAIDIYIKTLEIHEKNENIKGIVYTLNNMAVIYLYQENYEKSLANYLKTYKILLEIEDNYQLPAVLNNIGSVYFKTKQYDSALYYYNKSYEKGAELANKAEIARVASNLGLLYQETGDYNSATKYILEAIDIYEELNNSTGLSLCYSSYADILYLQEQNNKAIKMSQKALDFARNSNAFQEKKTALTQLSKFYAKNKNYKKAYIFLKEYNNLNDSLYDIEKWKVIENLTMVYETEKNEQKIELLEANQKIKDLQIKRRENFIFILILSLTIFLTLTIILFKINSKLNKAYKDIVDKNEEIIQQETHVGASIPKSEKDDTLNEKEIFIYNQLEKQLTENKAYTDENLTLDELAKSLNTNRSVLSKIINKKYKTNYNNLVNHYRVKEACRMISQNKHENYTLEAISKNVGFNSRSTFNSAFKKFIGVTPSFYIKSLK